MSCTVSALEIVLAINLRAANHSQSWISSVHTKFAYYLEPDVRCMLLTSFRIQKAIEDYGAMQITTSSHRQLWWRLQAEAEKYGAQPGHPFRFERRYRLLSQMDEETIAIAASAIRAPQLSRLVTQKRWIIPKIHHNDTIHHNDPN